jgi:hypothetical protein
MLLSKEDIAEINSQCPSEQGVFTEPIGIPNEIKEPVIYMRWETGGVSGGSCWESSNPQPYSNRESKPKFTVLDLVLKKIKPDLTYLEFREVEELVKSSEYTDWEYYGNHTNYEVDFIILSDLYKILRML